MKDDREGAGSSPAAGEELRRWLSGEVARWQEEGLVRDDQARRILARYGLQRDGSAAPRARHRMAQAVALLGAILVGTGIVLVVGANWDVIPPLLRLAVLMAGIALCYASGFWLAHVRRLYPGVGRALILLGSLAWGASIFLVAQSYHAGAEGGERTAVLIWLLGVLPLVHVLRSPEHAALAVILLAIWYGWTLGDHPARFPTPPPYFLLLILAGTALYCAGWLHRLRSELAAVGSVFALSGLAAVLFGLHGLSFDVYADLNAFGAAAGGPDGFLWAISAAAAGAGVALALRVQAVSRRLGKPESREGAALAGLALAAAICFLVTASGVRMESVRIPAIVTANALLLALEAGLVALGWQRMQPGLVNLGLAAFFVHLVTRYFDLIGSMLSGGFAFIAAGLVLIGAGWIVERQRRRLLESMEGKGERA